MGGTRLELPPQNGANSRAPLESGAESGALGAPSDPLGADLAAVVEAWPTLPEAVRASILAMVRAVR